MEANSSFASGSCVDVDEHTLTSESGCVDDIILITQASETAWENISDKQIIITRLRGEQINVSDRFTRYFEISCELQRVISEENEYFHHFVEINEQVMSLSKVLDAFETKLKLSEKAVRNLINCMRAHFTKVRKWMEAIKAGNSEYTNDEASIPSLSWVQMAPDPQLEILVDEWESVQLKDKITQHLNQIKNIAGSFGVDIQFEWDDADMLYQELE